MKQQEKRIEVNEMRLLRWVYGLTRKDKIRNKYESGTGFQKHSRRDDRMAGKETKESADHGYTMRKKR